MPKISYPFAALPNQICRGGHGAINLAVLAVLLSHGKTTASAATMAKEVGCDRKSVFAAIKYWLEKGPEFGMKIHATTRNGQSTVYEIEVIHMLYTTYTENGTGRKSTSAENGTGGVPKTEHPPVPKTVHKEEPIRRPHKNSNQNQKNYRDGTTRTLHDGSVAVLRFGIWVDPVNNAHYDPHHYPEIAKDI